MPAGQFTKVLVSTACGEIEATFVDGTQVCVRTEGTRLSFRGRRWHFVGHLKREENVWRWMDVRRDKTPHHIQYEASKDATPTFQTSLMAVVMEGFQTSLMAVVMEGFQAFLVDHPYVVFREEVRDQYRKIEENRRQISLLRKQLEDAESLSDGLWVQLTALTNRCPDPRHKELRKDCPSCWKADT